ncbi:MAG: PEP-CTERM sorting domain-containing protein [Planctomycetota bacterium]|nr:MAG: PEP-CTERM sorting domain-containing protein [Planctomycetota bacterium]
MTKKLKLLTLCLAVILAAGSTSFAALQLEVPEWRGTDGSTFQEWSFSNGLLNPPPDDPWDNDYGMPELTVKPMPGADWRPNPGAWPLSGQIDVWIPNNPQPNDKKEILLQVIWKTEDLDPSRTMPDEPWVAVLPFSFMDMSRTDTTEAGWTLSVFEINLYPNPSEEWFTIKGDIIVDHLAIDTRCVPEPATVALLGLGALVVFRRKRLHV